jgi:hypothetical protein
MSKWVQTRCKECESDNIVYDRSTDTEICADCGVVQEQQICDEYEFVCGGGADAAGACAAYASVACFGNETAGGGGGFGVLPSGVSKRTIAISSRPESAAPDIASRFGDLVKQKCQDRTGIRASVHMAAADILSIVLSRGVKSATTRNVPVLAAVCVHLATKLEHCERTDTEIMGLFDVKPKRFSAVTSDVLTAIAGHPLHAKLAACGHPLSLFPRLLHLCDETRLDPELYRRVYKASTSDIYRRAESVLIDAGISGNVISAALFHLASGRKASIGPLSEAVGVTSQTVMKAVKIAIPVIGSQIK